MKRGPIIHGVLLVAALLFAYQTWTREKEVKPTTGDVVLWSVPPATITKAVYAMSDVDEREVRLERRSDDQGSYLWGWETRTITETVSNKDKPPVINEAGAPIREVSTDKVSNTREFAVGEKGEETMEELAEMRALRDLGVITNEQKARYDLHEAKEYIEVTHGDTTRKLILGGKVFGGADRYALDSSSGRAYAISHEVIRDLMGGEPTLRLLKLHEYEKDEVGKAVIEVGEQKRTLARTRLPNEAGKQYDTWADADTPGKPNQTMANFLQSIDQLRPAIYESERTADEMELLVRVEYQGAAGESLGWIELYERPPEQEPAAETEDTEATEEAAAGEAEGSDAETADQAAAAGAESQGKTREVDKRKLAKKNIRPTYYMRTELTRVMAVVPYNQATRITEDIGQIFGP